MDDDDVGDRDDGGHGYDRCRNRDDGGGDG